MERRPKGIYNPEFRSEAVKQVQTTGMSVAQAAKQLSIPKSSLDNWLCSSRKGHLAAVGKGQRLPTDYEHELTRTRKQLADVKSERDLLKKFATYFAKESR
jgi:transposase